MTPRLYRSHLFLSAMATLVFVPSLLGQTHELAGYVFAYDPVVHVEKRMFGENREIVILQLSQADDGTYLKLVFKSLGQDQLDKKFFEGDALLTARAVRDQTCDLNSPEFLDGAALFSYLNEPVRWQPRKLSLTAHFNRDNPPNVASLKCYVVKSDVGSADQHLQLHRWRP
jgi:hypothetical protein